MQCLILTAYALSLMLRKMCNYESIDIDFDNDTVMISVYLFVNPGVKVKSVAEQVQSKVKNEVQSMTGITVSKVNVTISDVKYN